MLIAGKMMWAEIVNANCSRASSRTSLVSSMRLALLSQTAPESAFASPRANRRHPAARNVHGAQLVLSNSLAGGYTTALQGVHDLSLASRPVARRRRVARRWVQGCAACTVRLLARLPSSF